MSFSPRTIFGNHAEIVCLGSVYHFLTYFVRYIFKYTSTNYSLSLEISIENCLDQYDLLETSLDTSENCSLWSYQV